MKGRYVRLIGLLWLGWYLSGPVCESVDHWDGPRQEANDILFHAGGGLVILAAAALVGPRLFKKLRSAVLRSLMPNQIPLLSVPKDAGPVISDILFLAPSANSPPVPLRI